MLREAYVIPVRTSCDVPSVVESNGGRVSVRANKVMNNMAFAGEDAGKGYEIISEQINQPRTYYLLRRTAKLYCKFSIGAALDFEYHCLGRILSKAAFTGRM